MIKFHVSPLLPSHTNAQCRAQQLLFFRHPHCPSPHKVHGQKVSFMFLLFRKFLLIISLTASGITLLLTRTFGFREALYKKIGDFGVYSSADLRGIKPPKSFLTGLQQHCAEVTIHIQQMFERSCDSFQMLKEKSPASFAQGFELSLYPLFKIMFQGGGLQCCGVRSG